jgi:hypothetical protein
MELLRETRSSRDFNRMPAWVYEVNVTSTCVYSFIFWVHNSELTANIEKKIIYLLAVLMDI